MRFLAAILLLRAMSTHVVNCASAADDSSSAAREVCSTSDADGTATCNRQDDVVVVDGGGVRDAVATSSCIDLDPKCPSYEAEGACKSNPGYMTHYCARTCGYACDNGIDATPKCKDDNYQCLEWAGMGECDINPSYMKSNCPNSCLVCYVGTSQFGTEQRLPKVDSERELTEARLAQSIEYMKTVWTDEEHLNVRHKCRNQHEDCTFWASTGECENNASYMRLNCAPACSSCDDLDIRHRCPIEPGNESIWEAGDLNAMFERIVDNADGTGDYEKYNPRALSRPIMKRDGTPAPGVEKDGPWVVILENFVSHEEADRLVEIGKRQGYDRSADVGKEKPDGSHESKVSDSRTSHNTWCKEGCFDDPLVSPVVDRIANTTGTEIKNSEFLQLLQYEPGQYYKQHHDYISHHKEKPCGVRILTLFIYLNDVEEGGGTRFPLLDITVQPKKGYAVLWPSVKDQYPEDKDARTDHEALPVVSGLKYGANAWIHNRNYKEAYRNNCQ